MPCFAPIPALRERSSVRLWPPPGQENLRLPCGCCVGCKAMRASEWASRCMHELREHHSAVFATLTYDDAHLPRSGSLVPEDLQLFLKRFRKALESRPSWVNVNSAGAFAGRLRFFACGEYGDLKGRPHYHCILFGVSFNDSRKATHELSNSPAMERIWGNGTVNFGEVTRASCQYVAGYTTKSFGREYCDADGVVLAKPFMRASIGIGKAYADRYVEDFRCGHLVVDGEPVKLPRYYRDRMRRFRPDVAMDAECASVEVVREPFSEDRLAAGLVIAKRRAELHRSHSL